MKLARYTVRAKRVDTGEPVEGFLIKCDKSDKSDTGVCIWRKAETDYHMTDVDTETIEPLALPPVRHSDSEINYCPGCKTDLDLFKYNNEYFSPNYCPDCGQRLDWGKRAVSEDKGPNAVIVQRGAYRLGYVSRDKDGNVTKERPERWEPDTSGCAILVCDYDTENDKAVGVADLFAAWDSHGLEKRIREKLALTRRNFPTPDELYKWAKDRGMQNADFCEICEGVCAGYDCRICPIETIKAETEGGDGE
jgi:hypothetical protein